MECLESVGSPNVRLSDREDSAMTRTLHNIVSVLCAHTAKVQVVSWVVLFASCVTSPDSGSMTGRWEGIEQHEVGCTNCPAEAVWTLDVQESGDGEFEGTGQSVTVWRTLPDTGDFVFQGRREDGRIALSISCQPWEFCIPEPLILEGLRPRFDSIVLYIGQWGQLPTINLVRSSAVP